MRTNGMTGNIHLHRCFHSFASLDLGALLRSAAICLTLPIRRHAPVWRERSYWLIRLMTSHYSGVAPPDFSRDLSQSKWKLLCKIYKTRLMTPVLPTGFWVSYRCFFFLNWHDLVLTRALIMIQSLGWCLFRAVSRPVHSLIFPFLAVDAIKQIETIIRWNHVGNANSTRHLPVLKVSGRFSSERTGWPLSKQIHTQRKMEVVTEG